jgi:nitrogen fixation NifU-like protein
MTIPLSGARWEGDHRCAITGVTDVVYNKFVYSPQVLDHFEHPRHAGELENPDVVVQLENPACGDVLKLAIRVSEGRVIAVRFLAKGCVPAMACGSALAEMIQGRTVEELSTLRREDLIKHLGGLPPASMHASQLAIDTLRAALTELKTKS